MTNTRKPLAFLLSSEFANKYPHRLAAGFPHVMEKLEEYWNDSDALTEYFSELMVSKRPGRRGFNRDFNSVALRVVSAWPKVRKGRGAVCPEHDAERAESLDHVGL